MLLTLHPRVGAWVSLGGHIEPEDDTVLAAATREAHEESGIAGLTLDPVPIYLGAHPVTCSLGVPTRHLDVTFLAVAPRRRAAGAQRRVRRPAWFPVGALPADVVPDLPPLLARGPGPAAGPALMGVLDPVGQPGRSARPRPPSSAPTAPCWRRTGTSDAVFGLASVTKPLVALSVLVAVEEGALGLDDPAGPPGSTVRHLLAHASGIAPDKNISVAKPGTRRIYSNAGFDVLGDHLAAVTGIPCADYLRQALCEPLGLAGTALVGPPHRGAESTVGDLAAVAAELLNPGRLLHPRPSPSWPRVQFPGLSGVVPGFGRQATNDWGLGFEIRDSKSPHWTGAGNSPATYGHFGRSRHVPLGRPGGPARAGRAHRHRVRAVGQGRVAAAGGRGPARA